MRKWIFVFIVAFAFHLAIAQSNKNELDPDFEIATEAGNQVFREELAIALAKTPQASQQTRNKLKAQAEQLAANFFLKGQKLYKLPRKKLIVYWDLTKPIPVAESIASDPVYVLHFNEIMFFTYYDDHLKLIIPHEVGHLIHYQYWGFGNDAHDASFDWVMQVLSPNYKYKELDIGPACRLSSRLLAANGAFGYDPVCKIITTQP